MGEICYNLDVIALITIFLLILSVIYLLDFVGVKLSEMELKVYIIAL